MDIEERNIQEAIGQFYSFFGGMSRVKNEIEGLSMDDHTKDQIFAQLDEIEREYKYGQEWFMPREVQDVRVGVVGSELSLKTAVVSLFVEGVKEIEGDEKDGRSKSKINVDGRSKLLLIREETGLPSRQLCHWADIILLVFSYSDLDSLLQIRDFHRVFRQVNQDAPVMLVGVKDDDQYSFRRSVSEGEVRKTAELLERCTSVEVSLVQPSTYQLFAQACKLALSSITNSSYPVKFEPPTTLVCPNPSYSATGTGISQGVVAAGVQKFSTNVMPVSPSHMKRTKQRRSMFGGKQNTYVVSKSTESFGSGRPVPVKEGFVNKKSTGGLRAEWKRKYLELSQDELTYYPSLNEYMTKTHGKSLKLQQITVKVPGQRVSSVSKVTNTPSESTASDLTELLTPSQAGNQSDRSNSNSPGPLDSSLDVSYNSNSSRPGLRVTRPSFEYDSREYRSPLTPEHEDFGSQEQFEEFGMYNPPGNHKYEGHVPNGRGHNRNSSLDDNNLIMLQQLRTGGISYPPIEEDRSATMPRLDGKKARIRQANLLSTLPGSEEHLSGQGSQDSLGRPDRDRKKKGDKDRNSFLIERSQSESIKTSDKRGVKGHKRQRSWGGNKLLEVEGDVANDSCEFHVFSADNKVWCFEATSPEEAASWVKAIGDQIKKTISESVSHKRVNSNTKIDKKEILLIDGNNFCTDCNSPNPEWASLNHGCLLCIECSGVHRNLGTHISRIRSLELDEWSPELMSVMLHIGNKMSRSLWEANKPKNRPTHSTSREERERFIKAKYIDKEYLADLPYTGKPIYEQLMEAVNTDNIPNCLNILAHCTTEDIDTIHTRECWAALHASCSLGRIVITQLLIWNGGDINILDADKHTPLYYARSCGHQDIVNILLANSCTEDTSDTSV